MTLLFNDQVNTDSTHFMLHVHAHVCFLFFQLKLTILYQGYIFFSEAAFHHTQSRHPCVPGMSFIEKAQRNIARKYAKPNWHTFEFPL